jgi:cytochrome c-type biogenesis protein CcmH
MDKNNHAVDLYTFTRPMDEALFIKLTHELRCSVCQNQYLADSMAPLAIDLMNEIYKKVRDQHSEQQIIEFVTSRYGEFVLYRPPLQWNTSLLWFGPILMLILGMFIFVKNFKQPK